MMTMSSGAWLSSKLRDLIPPDDEHEAVRRALDEVERCLETEAGPFAIAQRYPCGSFAKSTMLACRKEADLVVVLSKAPTESTLEDLRSLLAQRTSARNARVLFKAVEVNFPDGMNVDVLPVAMDGITAAATSAPEKLRYARSGPLHVRWFIEKAHNTPIHPTVRLLKALRSAHAALERLRSFTVEVLAVDILEGFVGDLEAHFTKVLSRLADEYLENRVLLDPADPQNDLLAGLSASDRQRITEAARRALRHVESRTWSAVFMPAASALPSSNIGGRTLA